MEMTEAKDLSLAALAQRNLAEDLDPGEVVTAATMPGRSAALAAALSGFPNVQFVATSSGKVLLLGWEAEGGLTVVHLE